MYLSSSHFMTPQGDFPIKGAPLKILITGGTGYVASHVALELLRGDHQVLGTIKPKSRVLRVINQLKALTDKNKCFYYKADVRDEIEMDRAIGAFKPDAIINLAAVKVTSPTNSSRQTAWNVNVGQLKTLIKLMEKYKVHRLIQASTGNLSALYSTHSFLDQTKEAAENYLQDIVSLGSPVKIIALRLFNPSANLSCGYLAEDDYSGVDALLNQIARAATKEIPHVCIYPRMRDYTHVMDIARAFRKTIDVFDKFKHQYRVYDIGQGVGVSDIQLLQRFEEVNHIKVPYRAKDGSIKDPVIAVAKTGAAAIDLKWQAIKSLNEICNDVWFSHTLGTNSLIPAPFSRISSWHST